MYNILEKLIVSDAKRIAVKTEYTDSVVVEAQQCSRRCANFRRT